MAPRVHKDFRYGLVPSDPSDQRTEITLSEITGSVSRQNRHLSASADIRWTLTVYSSREDAIRSARAATLIAILVEILLGVSLLWLLRRRRHIVERATAEARYRVRLDLDVARRTQELRAVNNLLSKEISERQQAEGRLILLQADLVQANKLAQLGQITAGVAHEINQPLGAIRILADNCLALLGKKDSKASTLISNNLDTIVRLNERIGHITRELRAFSRKGNERPGLSL